MTLTLRNVEIGARAGMDVRIEDGKIAAIGANLSAGGQDFDGRGGALIPGLRDNHIHLLALAARTDSVVLDGVTNARALAERIGAAIATKPTGAWIRVLGYHETIAGELTRKELDALAPNHRVRVQHQTGALWILNSAALASLGDGADPPNLERETGFLWRGDAWLHEQLGAQPPPLAPIGAMLARYGITSLTDASVTTDASAASVLAEAVRSGALPQRLTLMSGGALSAPADGAFSVGPVKILLDDHTLPDLDDFIDRIKRAREWRRAIAVHCVTAGELALTLAAFEAAGARDGDRIEHGSVIPHAAIAQIKGLGLSVVTQSAFIRERGDRYAAEVAPNEFGDLYRCASLIAAGVPVTGSSDAPYASPDPWQGISAATDRRSAGGLTLSAEEALTPSAALGLYLGQNPELSIGAPADLCLLRAPLADMLDQPHAEHVRATLLGGAITYHADAEDISSVATGSL